MSVLSIAIPVPGAMRRARVVAVTMVVAGVVAGALGGAPAASADVAAASRPASERVCASRATLYESPGGAKVGVVHHGDRVTIVAIGADDGWWRVAASFGTRGWIRESALCRRAR